MAGMDCDFWTREVVPRHLGKSKSRSFATLTTIQVMEKAAGASEKRMRFPLSHNLFCC